MRRLLLLWVAVWPITALATPAASPLITPEELATAPDTVVVLDVRSDTAGFATEGHIPGAVLLPWDAVRTTRRSGPGRLQKMRPDPESFAERLRERGVDNDSRVIITTPGTSAGHFARATRLFWQLHILGHEAVAILDGGNAAWRAAGYGLSQEKAKPATGTFQAEPHTGSLIATTAAVADAVEAGSVQLVDNRPLAYFLGLEQKSYVSAAGRLPGAAVMPFDLVTKAAEESEGPVRLRSTEALRDLVETLDFDPEAPTVTYCNSGNVASVGWFVLHELLGNRSVRLYDGSMHAWAQDADRPVVGLESAP